MFKVCYQSVMKQSYPNFAFIVGSDVPCEYYRFARPLKLETRPDNLVVPQGHYYAPHNLLLNDLANSCTQEWCLAIDDDDAFVDENSLQTIVDNIDHEDQLLIWKVQILPNWSVPSHSFGKAITACDFSGIGFMYHSKHNPVDWGRFSMGDYRVGKQLEAKGLELKWIDKVLTKTQKGPHGNNYGL
jgi:hypothetical protein